MKNERPRNDLVTIASQLESHPKYGKAGMVLRTFVESAIERGALPEEIVLEPEIEIDLSSKENSSMYYHPLFDYDRKNGTINFSNNESVRLTKMENSILQYLSLNPNIYVSADEIMRMIKSQTGKLVIKTHIHHIRKKIPFRDVEIIKNKPDFGYMFFNPSVEIDESRLN